MAKYHLTDNGPKMCVASPGKCKYKLEETEHYNNFTEAQAIYESRNRSQLSESLTGVKKGLSKSALLRKSLEFFKANINNITIPNKSGKGNNFVKLSDLQDGQIAGNNCYHTTVIINDLLKSRGVDSEVADLTLTDGSVHYANKVGDNVLDYTFRQFDERSEFPVVMKEEDWLERVDSAVFNKFGVKIQREEEPEDTTMFPENES